MNIPHISNNSLEFRTGSKLPCSGVLAITIWQHAATPATYNGGTALSYHSASTEPKATTTRLQSPDFHFPWKRRQRAANVKRWAQSRNQETAGDVLLDQQPPPCPRC